MKMRHKKLRSDIVILVIVFIGLACGCIVWPQDADLAKAAADLPSPGHPVVTEERTSPPRAEDVRREAERRTDGVRPATDRSLGQQSLPPAMKERTFQPFPDRPPLGESPVSLTVKRKLDTVKIGLMDFYEEKLSNVLKALTAASGVNFAVEELSDPDDPTWLPSHLESAYQQKTKSQKKKEDEIANSKITVYLKDVTLLKALAIICKQKNLCWEIVDEGYVRLSDANNRVTVSFDEQSFAGLEVGKVFSRGIIRKLDAGGKEMKKVLEELSRRTGINIICKPYLESWLVRIHLENVTVQAAIEAICAKYYLWYTSNPAKDYICLIGNEEFAGETSVDYRIQTRVFNLQYASAPQVADSIGSVMGNRVEYILPSNLNSYEHIKLPDMDITKGKIESQKSHAKITTEIDTPKLKDENISLEKIQSIIDRALELRLTAADVQRINKQVGFAIMSIFLRNNAILISSADERLLKEIESVIRQLDVPTPQALIECRILSVTLSNDFSSFFQIVDSQYSTSTISDAKKGSVLYANYLGAEGASALYSLVSDKFQINAKIRLLQKDGLVNTISTPMVLAAQNTQAEISSGNNNVPIFKNISVVQPTFNEYGNLTTSGYTTPQYDTIDLVGTKLRITPQINEDRGVTLRIKVEQSVIDKNSAEIKYTGFNSSGQPNPVWTTDTVDTLRKNTLETIAVIPEGYMLVLGGFIENEDSLKEEKVPVLGNIPVVGFFFRSKDKAKLRKEMVIIITPRVLMAPTEAARVTSETVKGMSIPAAGTGENVREVGGTKRKPGTE
jgi:general secretion pathway protein D